MPTVGVFVAKLVHHMFLYTTRVKCNWRQRIGLGHRRHGTHLFDRPRHVAGRIHQDDPLPAHAEMRGQGGLDRRLPDGPGRDRADAVAVVLRRACILFAKGWNDIDARMWALVLSVQSLPYLASLTTAMISAMPTDHLMKHFRAKARTSVPP